jgi:hypothetical protein
MINQAVRLQTKRETAGVDFVNNRELPQVHPDQIAPKWPQIR